MASAQLKPEPASKLGELPPEDIFFGASEVMQGVRQRLERASNLDVPILILGPSGSGKGILAQLIHARSPWRSGPFVKVNCPAIPGALLESELFGYQRGAFTGANADKSGRMELAQGGTLFLDEIAELDAGLQAKLLHVLQDGHFTRVGGDEERRLNARIVCATGRLLREEIDAGNFRLDLFYRINVVAITLPPLRERHEDIPRLAEYLRQQFNRRFLHDSLPFSDETLRFLHQRDWPGNIRELENWVARYVVLGSEEALHGERPARKPSHFLYEPADDGKIPLKRIAQQATRKMEREVILKVLQENHWNRRKAAETLKISYRALLYKVRQAGLPAKRPRKPLPHAGEFPAESASPAD